MNKERFIAARQLCLAFGAAGCLLLGAARAQEQSFQPVAPKQPAGTGAGRVENETAQVEAGHGNTTVLVDRLRGLVFVADGHRVRKAGLPRAARPIEPGPVAFAARPDFQQMLEPYLGRPVTLKSLGEISRAIVAYYRDHDRPVVNVYVPEQNITSGVVQVVVVEGRVGAVAASGAKYFSNDDLRDSLRLRHDEPVSGQEVRDDLAWLNRNPFRRSDLLFSPGAVSGSTDALLRTEDRFPLRFFGGYEDSGTEVTGEDRYLIGFNYGNLFGLGQELSYQFTMAEDTNRLTAHSGTYVVPLPWHHELTFFGFYSEASGDVAPFTTGGVTWQASMRYEVPLPGTLAFSHSLFAGFDFKQSNNDLEFGGTTVSNVYTDVAQFVLAYQATYLDQLGSTTGSVTAYLSPGDWAGHANSNAAYEATRAGAVADYAYEQLSLQRVTRLPWNLTWSLRALYQFSDSNLLPSEELGLGGYATVRGYDEREANGDTGFLLSNEIATPPFSLLHFFGFDRVKDQLQFLAFVDYGGTSLHRVTAADENPNINLLGIGPGLRYSITPYFALRFDYGFQLLDTGLDSRHNSRGHLGIQISY